MMKRICKTDRKKHAYSTKINGKQLELIDPFIAIRPGVNFQCVKDEVHTVSETV